MREIQTTAWIFGTDAWFWVLTELVKVKPPCDGFLNERDNEQPVKRKVFSWIFFMLFFFFIRKSVLKKLNLYWFFFLRHMLSDGWLLDVIWGSKMSWNEKKNSNLMDSWWPLITFHSSRLVWNLWHCSLSVMCYTAFVFLTQFIKYSQSFSCKKFVLQGFSDYVCVNLPR